MAWQVSWKVKKGKNKENAYKRRYSGSHAESKAREHAKRLRNGGIAYSISVKEVKLVGG